MTKAKHLVGIAIDWSVRACQRYDFFIPLKRANLCSKEGLIQFWSQFWDFDHFIEEIGLSFILKGRGLEKETQNLSAINK